MRINQQSYTRRQALNDLMRAENKQDDAVDNLKMIVGSLDETESLKAATDGFIGVLNTVGASETAFAQSAYKQVDGRVKQGEDRTEGLENFVKMIRAENQMKDAVGNFDSVSHAVDQGLERTNSTDNFHKILSSVGASETTFAREAFGSVVDSLRTDESLDSTVSNFRNLLSKENKLEDALSGYQLVNQNLQAGEDRDHATKTYTDLLGGFGYSETSQAQSAFSQVQQRVVHGEDREVATNAFLSLLSRENKLEDAAGNFDSVTRAVDRGFDRTDSTGEFNGLLRKMGASETSTTRAHYGMVLDSLREGEKLSDALDLHSDIFSAENKFEDVKTGYELVNSVVSDTVSRADATEYYVSLLGEYGASATGDAQQAFRETHEIILG